MGTISGIARFLYDFFVGDDWVGAVAVIVILAGAGSAAHAGVELWWLVPIAVIGVLALTLRRAITRL